MRSATLPSQERIRVLLVDDNDDDRRWIERLLDEARFSEHEIVEADCLEQAIERVKNASVTFDLCICDWELPDGAGIELAQHPRIAHQRLPVIVITGNERPEQGAFAVGHGAADFLPKDDITPRALARACAHALARSELEREIDQLRRAELAATEREHAARLAAEAALVDERRARKRVTALQGLSSMLAAATTTQDIANVVVQRLVIFEDATAISLHLRKSDVLQLEAAVGAHEASEDALPLAGASPQANAVRDERAQRSVSGAQRSIAVPLITSGAVIGVLTVSFQETALPAPDELAYIELIAQQVAQALQRARLYEEAQQAAAFEERMLTVIGHDLRTPLSAIVMVAQLLEARGSQVELVARLSRSADRMNGLISDVLDRAAVRRGVSSQRAVHSTELDALLQDQVDELRAALPGTPIQLEIAGPLSVQCEPSRTSQIVSNLVRNAAQHGRNGSAVTIRLEPHETGAAISVHNLGAPIPAEELPHLFDPFKRGRRAGGAGTGLGLFIVHESVAALGGEIAVRSDADGTTFHVTLPPWPQASGGDSSSPP